MSLKALPLIFLNMGGEMCYILDQRLQAQSVRKEKAVRVMNDICSTMFNAKFLDELFKPQEQYSKRAMRTLFDKLAHSSIMRLNTTSMDKLYDLMTMAVKYQLQNCASPNDLLLLTMNHLDGIRKLIQGSPNVQAQIDYAYKQLSQTFFKMNAFELLIVRQTLINFYQDARVKVSILLREKLQRDDGRFVIPTTCKIGFGIQPSGIIKVFSGGVASKTIAFSSGGTYTETTKAGSLELTAKAGERVTDLGTNMYKNQSADTQGGYGSSYNTAATPATAAAGGGSATAASAASKETLAKEELNLLGLLVKPSGNAETDFSLSLFESAQEEEAFVAAAIEAVKTYETIMIDASKRDTSAVDKLVGDMSKASTKPKKAKGDELLDLMDAK